MNLVEIFSSVQGEGLYVGASTLFVRFGACDLRCAWCDSPHTWKPAGTCRVEVGRGSGVHREFANPVSLEAAVGALVKLEPASHRFLSLTGGEPLLQPEAVLAIAGRLRALGPRIHLETHGLAAEALEQVLREVDLVSMDWKLASDVRRAGSPRSASRESFHAAHERFLKVAVGAPEVQIKVVVTPASEDRELDEMVRRIERVDPRIPLILQPVTPQRRQDERPSAERMLALGARFERSLQDVRIVPQTHPLYAAP